MRPAPGRNHNVRRPMASHHHSVRPPRPHRPYYAPLFGHRVSYLPHGYVVRHIGGRPYYYYDGIYYRPYRYGGYYVCRPPLGTVFAATLFDAAMTAVAINTIRDEINRAVEDYYYQNGVFYTRENDEYRVVEAPVGAQIDQIPSDYEEVQINGETYYKVEDTLYKPTVVNGRLVFEVVCTM